MQSGGREWFKKPWSSKNKVFEKILSVTKEAVTEKYHKCSIIIILVKMITYK